MAALTTQRSGNWSDTVAGTTPWTALTGSGTGGVPGDGDTVTIGSGHAVVADVTTAIGSNVSGVGIGITIAGASSSSYGTLTVANGVVLTLRGNDISTNRAMLVNRYGKLIMNAGAVVELDCASDYQSILDIRGIVQVDGTSGSHAAFRSPASRISWANSANETVVSSSSYTAYDYSAKIYSVAISGGNKIWVSNAAHTGIGSFGDSSISFNSHTTGVFTTEVATIEAVNGAGKYCVDYERGVLYFYWATPSTLSYNFDYYYLSFTAGCIQIAQNTTYNQATFTYCDFNYMGTAANADWVLNVRYKQSDTYSSSGTRKFQMDNCTFNFCKQPLCIRDTFGTSGDKIQLNNTTFNHWKSGSYCNAISLFRAATGYLQFNNVIANGRDQWLLAAAFGVVVTHDHFEINNIIMHCQGFMQNTNGPCIVFPDGAITGYFHMGLGGVDSLRSMDGFMGTSGHITTQQNTIISRGHRALNYTQYSRFTNGVIADCYHHGINAFTFMDVSIPGVEIDHLIIISDGYNDGAHAEFGYNYRTQTDGGNMHHLTLINNQGKGGFAFGDELDNSGAHLTLNAKFTNSIMYGNISGARRPTDSATNMTKIHMAQADYHCFYGNTADYANYTQFATFSKSGSEYNTNGSRNITGAVLINPSASLPTSGLSLVFTVTALGSNETIGLSGGTPVQLVHDSGTATAGAQITGVSSIAGLNAGTLTDSGKSWNTSFNNALCPTGKWIKITGGTGAGQIRRITNNTATVATVVPSWSTIPDATSTYTIYKAEVSVDDGATNTVSVGLDYTTMPTTSKTDASISWANHVVALDPQFVDTTRNLASWDAAKGGSGTELGAKNRLVADTTLLTSDLLPYLQAGFAPQNAALMAASDGGWIGAADGSIAGNAGGRLLLLNVGS